MTPVVLGSDASCVDDNVTVKRLEMDRKVRTDGFNAEKSCSGKKTK